MNTQSATFAPSRSPSRKETFTCRICGHTGEQATYVVPEMLYGTREPFKYFQCSACDCLQHAAIPEDLGRYYPGDYYSYTPIGQGGRWRKFKDKLEWKRDRYAFYGRGWIGRLLQAALPEVALPKLAKLKPRKDARILDVGSGSGRFLYYMADDGFKQVAGVDPFIRETVTYPNGLVIHKQDLLATTGKWDIIMFNHSFEHIPDNLGTLAKVRELLADGGSCVIEVPTVSGWAWEHYGIHWGALDAPRHIFLHSLKSFRLLAERAGLAVKEVQYNSLPAQFWVSDNFRRGVTHMVPRNLWERLAYPLRRSLFFLPQYARANRLNREGRGDCVAFYLQKK